MARRSDTIALIDRLQGSDQAKERAKALLRVARNEITMEAAAAELGISTQRLHDLRESALMGLVDACEAKPPGRPRAEVVPTLRDAIVLPREFLNEIARARTEIALAFGNRLGGGEKNSR
jgi:hypothetical protein